MDKLFPTLISLTALAIGDEEPSDGEHAAERERLTSDIAAANCVPRLAALAKVQNIESLVYTGLLRAGVPESAEGMVKLRNAAFGRALVCERQSAAYQRISSALEAAGLDYLPLKGLVSRELYTSVDQRPMGDLDILIRSDKLDEASEVMHSMGYSSEPGFYHEHPFDNGSVHVELHTALISSINADFYPYFGDGWSRAKHREGHLWRYSREDELVYSVVHFAKHYRNGGAGVKFVVDIEQYIRRVPELDVGYVREELDSLGLGSFFDNILRLCRVWFEGGEYDDVTLLMTECIYRGGIFGTSERRIAAQVARETDGDAAAASHKHVLRMMFPRYKDMKKICPFVERTPLLLPAGYAVRALRLLFFRRDRIHGLVSEVKGASPENTQKFIGELNAVGLNTCHMVDNDM